MTNIRNIDSGSVAEAAMRHRQLGDSDVKFSVIAMGTWGISRDAVWGPQEEQDSVNTIKAALDAGIDSFDSAEDYGEGYAEEVLGKALKGVRDRAVIATKLNPRHLTRDGVRQACEASLKRLQTDHIDLYQIHWPNHEIPLSQAMPTFDKLKQEGKIRALGVSNFGVQDLDDILSVGRPVTNQMNYSLLFRAIEFEILPKCRENNIGILCYSSLEQGLLTGKFKRPEDVPEGRTGTRLFSQGKFKDGQGDPGTEEEVFKAIDEIRKISDEIGHPMEHVAIAWLLAQKGVVSILAGARHPKQVQDNAQAAQLQLPREIVDRLTRATDGLKRRLGPNPDMWMRESRIR